MNIEIRYTYPERLLKSLVPFEKDSERLTMTEYWDIVDNLVMGVKAKELREIMYGVDLLKELIRLRKGFLMCLQDIDSFDLNSRLK